MKWQRNNYTGPFLPMVARLDSTTVPGGSSPLGWSSGEKHAGKRSMQSKVGVECRDDCIQCVSVRLEADMLGWS